MAEAAVAQAVVQSQMGGEQNKFIAFCTSSGPAFVAIVSLALQGVAFAFNMDKSPVVHTSFVISAVCSLIVCYLAYMKKKSMTFRELNNMMNEQVEALAQENETLKENVDHLGDAVNGLQEFEGHLSALAEQNGKDVNQMVNLVKESQKVSDEQQECVFEQAKVDITQIVLNAFDTSSSNVYLDDSALEHFLLGLETVDTIRIVDEDTIRSEILATNRSLISILRLTNIMVEDDGDDSDLEHNHGVKINFSSLRGDLPKPRKDKKIGSDNEAMDELFDSLDED